MHGRNILFLKVMVPIPTEPPGEETPGEETPGEDTPQGEPED